MKQSLHIFAKDSRHLWIEITLSLLVTAIFVMTYPSTWQSIHGAAGGALERKLHVLAQVFVVLVPVSWGVLIARLVYEECLVGHKQFWITRPYEWPKLLCAKLLFLLVFIIMPFSAAQWCLLWEAGFDPRHFIAGILFNLFMTIGVLVLPLLALAAVTRHFGWMLLWLVGLIAYAGLVALIYSWIGPAEVTTPFSDVYSLPVLILVTAAAVVVQYARRRVWLACGLLVSAMLALAVMATALPTQSMVDAAYTSVASPTDLPMQVMLVNNDERPLSIRAMDSKKEVELDIPFESSGVVPGRAVLVEDAKVTLDGEGGTHLELPWRGISDYRYLPGSYSSTIPIKMDRAALDRFRHGRVTITLALAMTEVEAGPSIAVPLGEGEVHVPGFGICPQTAWRSLSLDEGSDSCRFPMNTPKLTYVQVEPDAKALGNPETADGVLSGWTGSLDPGLAEMGITSVWTSYFSLQNAKGQWRKPSYASGTVHFTPYSLMRHVRVQSSLMVQELPKEDSSRSTLTLIR